jgi:hypothetical protein
MEGGNEVYTCVPTTEQSAISADSVSNQWCKQFTFKGCEKNPKLVEVTLQGSHNEFGFESVFPTSKSFYDNYLKLDTRFLLAHNVSRAEVDYLFHNCDGNEITESQLESFLSDRVFVDLDFLIEMYGCQRTDPTKQIIGLRSRMESDKHIIDFRLSLPENHRAMVRYNTYLIQ